MSTKYILTVSKIRLSCHHHCYLLRNSSKMCIIIGISKTSAKNMSIFVEKYHYILRRNVEVDNTEDFCEAGVSLWITASFLLKKKVENN